MDPYSRRFFWDFIKARKQGRLIVLTTHMLDEAELLGDRIGIMSQGALRCCGSPLFLKNAYGAGYTMTMSTRGGGKPTDVHLKAIDSRVSRHISEAVLLAVSGGEISYRLPFDTVSKFPALFQSMDADIICEQSAGKSELGIDSYGVAVTNMEHVFLCAVQSKTREAASQPQFSADSPKMNSMERKTQYFLPFNESTFSLPLKLPTKEPKNPVVKEDYSRGSVKGCALFRAHFFALIAKRWRLTKRDKRSLAMQFALPLLTVFLGLFALRLGVVSDYGPDLISPAQLNNGGSNPLLCPYNTIALKSDLPCPANTLYQPNNCTCFLSRTDCELAPFCEVSQKSNYNNNNNPESCSPTSSGPGSVCMRASACFNQCYGMSQPNTGSFYNGTPIPPDYACSSPLSLSTLFSATEGFGMVTMQPISTLKEAASMSSYLLATLGSLPTDDPATFVPVPAGTAFDPSLIDNPRYGAFFSPPFSTGNSYSNIANWYSGFRTQNTNGAPVVTRPVAAFINGTATHGVPIFTNVLNNALLREATGSQNARIYVYSQPLQLTAIQRASLAHTASLISVLVLAIGFGLVPTSFVIALVREREVNSKHQQLVSGVTLLSYWLSAYVWDFLAFFVTGACCVVVVRLMEVEALTSGLANLNAFCSAVLLYGVGVVPFAHLFSFLFTSPASAQAAMLFFNILSGVLMPVATYFFALVPTLANTARILKFIFRCIPLFAFTDSLLALLNRTGPTVTAPKDQLDLDVAGYDLLYMAFAGPVFFLLVQVIERPHLVMAVRARCFRRLPSDDISFDNFSVAEDVDVTAERSLIMRRELENAAASPVAIECRGLRKVYGKQWCSAQPTKVAVKNFWLAVPEGQCFGFLGLNGAGKTTTLSILSGDKFASHGSASICGLDIQQNQEKVRQLIGYTPQFDALFDLMTAREHLDFYASIKGYSNILKIIINCIYYLGFNTIIKVFLRLCARHSLLIC